MFIASRPLKVQPSSVGATCFAWRWTDRTTSATKKHAAPTELGQRFGLVVSINMALLTELFASPTRPHLGIKDPRKEQIPARSALRWAAHL